MLSAYNSDGYNNDLGRYLEPQLEIIYTMTYEELKVKAIEIYKMISYEH